MSSSFLLAELEARVLTLEYDLAALSEDYTTSYNVDTFWVLINAIFVFLMQVGFAMLEVGSVASKNTKAVLLKNTGDAAIGAISWWLLGHGFAYGSSKTPFIGTSNFAMQFEGTEEERAYNLAVWLFSWAFAATSATIVSGAVAERVKISAYILYSVIITTFIYPVVVHWVWYVEGWASAMRHDPDLLLFGCGAVDFAGSSVVHIVGGGGAFMGAWVAKPRSGRFGEEGTVNRLPQQSPALQTLGTMILWAGWYGFNGGSSLTITSGRSAVAATAMVNTTIAPSAAAMTIVVLVKVFLKKFDSSMVNNGILCGLVAVTAGSGVVAPEGSFVIGVVAGFVYFWGSWLLTMVLRVDDVVDATPVHFFGGIWGMIAVGLFTTQENYAAAYDSETGNDVAGRCSGVFYGGGGQLLAANIVFALSVIAWTLTCHFLLFTVISMTIGLRVPPHIEDCGMDKTRRGRRRGGQALTKALSKAGPETHVVSLHDDLGAVPVLANGLPVMGTGAAIGSNVMADTAIWHPQSATF